MLSLVLLGVFQVGTVLRLEAFGYDESVYITVAHNILETGSYEFDYRPQIYYPPGFPALLACISLLAGGGKYAVFIRFMPVFTTLALIVWYFVLKRHSGRLTAAGCCLLAATSAPLFEMATQSVASDPAFFLASGLAVWFLMRLELTDTPQAILFFAGALSFTAAAVLIRSAGIALCAGIMAWALAAHLGRGPATRIARRAAVSAALAGLLMFGLWTAWGRRVGNTDTYTSQFALKDFQNPDLGKASTADLVVRATSHLPLESSRIAGLLTRFWIAPLWYSPLVLMTFMLLVAGSVSCIFENRGTLIVAYFLAYFAMCLLWHIDESYRFMLPVAPLAFFLIWRGLLFLGRLMHARPLPAIACACLFAAAVAMAAFSAPRDPGLQARASLAFWPAIAVVLALASLLARHTGAAKASAAMNSLARFIPGRGIAGAVIVAIGAGLFQQVAISRTNLAPNPSLFRHYPSTDCAAWLRTAAEGTVMAQQFAILHRLSGRRVEPFPITGDPKVIASALIRKTVRYLVVNDPVKFEFYTPPEEDRYQQLQRLYPYMLALVHRGPGYRVYEVRH